MSRYSRSSNNRSDSRTSSYSSYDKPAPRSNTSNGSMTKSIPSQVYNPTPQSYAPSSGAPPTPSYQQTTPAPSYPSDQGSYGYSNGYSQPPPPPQPAGYPSAPSYDQNYYNSYYQNNGSAPQ